jgi:hypothetical protein
MVAIFVERSVPATFVDAIRRFVADTTIDPARKKREATVVVLALQVHEAMRLNNCVPAVCGALDAEEKFLEFAHVGLISRTGFCWRIQIAPVLMRSRLGVAANRAAKSLG